MFCFLLIKMQKITKVVHKSVHHSTKVVHKSVSHCIKVVHKSVENHKKSFIKV